MAVPEQTPYKEYTANGVTKIFPLEFDVLEQDHLIVLVNDLEPSVGSWSLDAVNDSVVFALPPANGANIKIRRDTPLERPNDYGNYNATLKPTTVNTDFDNIWRKLQEMGVLNWMIDNNIRDLNEYVDSLNDETKAIFLQMIQEQGTSLEQLDAYVDQLYKNLANVAADNGWFAEFVADGDENQKQINDKTTRYCKNISELLDIPVRVNGQEVSVTCLRQGGDFYFDKNRKNENNGGTCFNGWVRKYYGSVYLDWFLTADPATNDCSLALENALKTSRGVKCSGREYLFTNRVGIPDNEQSNYAWRVIKIHGDGDTVFNIDSKLHGRAVFTSEKAKADPELETDAYVGKIDFWGINFWGVNTTRGFELTEENKNITDIVFDGDRLYSVHASKCNFIHLKNVLKCIQSRGSIEGGNAYSQSFDFSDNRFFHNTKIVEADTLIDFTFFKNKCDKNYAGVYAKSKAAGTTSASVIRIDHNLWQASGQFIDLDGDVVAGSIDKNYFEYNIYEDVLINKCQIKIKGNTNGLFIGVNAFGGQIDFNGYNTDYMDIILEDKPYDDSGRTDVLKSKPVLMSNFSTSRQLVSASRAIQIGNSSPYFIQNGWIKDTNPYNYFNSKGLHSHQENDVSFARGIFNKPLEYQSPAVDGHIVKTHRDSDASVIVAILDLSRLEDGPSKNKLSTLTGELDCNIEWIRDSLTIGNVSAKIHVSIIQTGYGSNASSQYNQVRVNAKLMSIIQPFDIPIVSSNPTNLMKKQFVEPDVSAVIESLGGGRYAIRLTNYLGVSSGTFGAPLDIYNSFTWKSSVGCRDNQDQVGNSVTFIGFWW